MALRIGIDVGGTKIEGIALDGSREAARLRIDTPRDDYDATLAAIRSIVRNLERVVSREPRTADADPTRRPTVGIGIPGTVAPATGLVKNANSTWLIGRPLQRDLERDLGREVRIANDANCLALSEATDGAGAGADVVFAVIAGTGVGGGIAVKGRVLTGPNGIAGEWGHNPLPWAGEDEGSWPRCYCGKEGCIETFLSGPAMMADHERSSGLRLSPPEIVAEAANGNAAAEGTLGRYETRMARALASIINVLDPDVIVFGGGMSHVARLYTNVPNIWRQFIFSAQQRTARPEQNAPIGPFEPTTKFVPARYGASSGVRGAAWLWGDATDAR